MINYSNENLNDKTIKYQDLLENCLQSLLLGYDKMLLGIWACYYKLYY